MSPQHIEWQDIASAPKPEQWLRNGGIFLIALFHQRRDEDGEPEGEPELLWVHVAYLTANGWMVGTGGFKGVHGHASFPLNDNATHWAKMSETLS